MKLISMSRPNTTSMATIVARGSLGLKTEAKKPRP
jgi:hypothetical protein